MVGQGKGGDHRVNALLITHPEWVPEPWLACPRVLLGNSWIYVYSDGSGIPPGCNRIIAREPVVVPPATPERPTGYLLPTLRVGLVIGK